MNFGTKLESYLYIHKKPINQKEKQIQEQKQKTKTKTKTETETETKTKTKNKEKRKNKNKHKTKQKQKQTNPSLTNKTKQSKNIKMFCLLFRFTKCPLGFTHNITIAKLS